MRLVLQRVSQAHVEVDACIVGAIDEGLLALVGVAKGDTEAIARKLARKTLAMRIFNLDTRKMNLSVIDKGGAILVVSQFTLVADTDRGNRPSFDQAALASEAKHLYHCFVDECRLAGVRTETGVFQADMRVHIVNAGPVTFVVDSKNLHL
jgi:D-tyrosyl-tRNA(Tyr) deacylase